MSIAPLAKPLKISLFSFAVLNRDKPATFIGNPV